MIAINRLICFAMLTTAIVVSGCGNIKPSKTLSISGVNTSGLLILENDDGRTAVLTGRVERVGDRYTVERHVRAEYDYDKIVNRITFD